MANGISSAADYPYVSYYGDNEGACQHDSANSIARVTSKQEVAYYGGNVSDIRAALEHGPLTIALRAGLDVFMYYDSGVIDAANWDGWQGIDHAVIIVGYELHGGETTIIETEDWSHCEMVAETEVITTESYDHCEWIQEKETIQEESWDHCEVIEQETSWTKRRCRRPTAEEREAEDCWERPRWEWEYEWETFVNRRGKEKTRDRCCRYIEKTTTEEIIDPDCEPVITETEVIIDEYWDPTCEPIVTEEIVETGNYIRDPTCEANIIEEEVTTDAMPVWVVQNSWGTAWGDDGFVRIEATDGYGVLTMNFWTQLVSVE